MCVVIEFFDPHLDALTLVTERQRGPSLVSAVASSRSQILYLDPGSPVWRFFRQAETCVGCRH